MAPHSSTLAWKIPWMEEPGRLQSMGSLRVGHDWATSLSHIGEGNGNPLQCSCLENPRDRGAWWAAVYGVAQSRTRLKWLSSGSSIHTKIMNNLVLFYVWKNARVWAHWNYSFDVHLSYLGPISCVCVVGGGLFQGVSAVGWWFDEGNILCWLIWQRHFSSIILTPSGYSKNHTLPLVAHNSVLQDHRTLNFPSSYFILFL